MTLGATHQMITARVAQIDHLISIQLNEILHHLSSKNLRYLAGLNIFWTSPKPVLSKDSHPQCSKKELLRDCTRAGIRSNAMFKKLTR